ncbi:uncharacterized protein LOC121478685 [Vulpes lagopus]|uniref:uncharacterized protein LOC121478685 n=1 Tax=Vulpes lagopus TaxID=494514 RepID=UPI001BC97736|nr:uncharacterized protein LOC121478685 [Vulpes lagopus]
MVLQASRAAERPVQSCGQGNMLSTRTKNSAGKSGTKKSLILQLHKRSECWAARGQGAPPQQPPGHYQVTFTRLGRARLCTRVHPGRGGGGALCKKRPRSPSCEALLGPRRPCAPPSRACRPKPTPPSPGGPTEKPPASPGRPGRRGEGPGGAARRGGNTGLRVLPHRSSSEPPQGTPADAGSQPHSNKSSRERASLCQPSHQAALISRTGPPVPPVLPATVTSRKPSLTGLVHILPRPTGTFAVVQVSCSALSCDLHTSASLRTQHRLLLKIDHEAADGSDNPALLLAHEASWEDNGSPTLGMDLRSPHSHLLAFKQLQ